MSTDYLWSGHSKSVKKVLKGASLLLPNSENEYKRLLNRYGEARPYEIIPNAIDPSLFGNYDMQPKRSHKSVLCVGRFEGLKNQLTLIRALNNTEFNLILVGKPATNQSKYFEQCRAIAENNISFIYDIMQDQLVDYYQNAYVHALPSWFETTGLSSLEAAASGCNIVVTSKGDTREYFEDMAFYCEPSSSESIYEAIKKASEAPFNESLRQKIMNQYTWPIAAQKTLEAYKKIVA